MEDRSGGKETMADARDYRQEIDELIAINQAAEVEIDRLEQGVAAAYELFGRKAYTLMSSLAAEQRNRLLTESARVDELNAAVAHQKKAVAERSERIRQLQALMRVEHGIDRDADAADDGARLCPVCGMQIQPDYLFCPGCAHKVSELFPPESGPIHMECPRCHRRWRSDMSFCAECGVKLVKAAG